MFVWCPPVCANNRWPHWDLKPKFRPRGPPRTARKFQDRRSLHSGRERFRRKLQLIDLCIKDGKDAVAQPLLDDLAAELENHKLEDWEDQEFVTGALVRLMSASKRIQGDAKEKQKLFERLCRLNPLKALSC